MAYDLHGVAGVRNVEECRRRTGYDKDQRARVAPPKALQPTSWLAMAALTVAEVGGRRISDTFDFLKQIWPESSMTCINVVIAALATVRLGEAVQLRWTDTGIVTAGIF